MQKMKENLIYLDIVYNGIANLFMNTFLYLLDTCIFNISELSLNLGRMPLYYEESDWMIYFH